MWLELLKAGVALAVLLPAWLLVQRSWRRAFGLSDEEADRTAGPLGCGSCARAADGPTHERTTPWS